MWNKNEICSTFLNFKVKMLFEYDLWESQEKKTVFLFSWPNWEEAFMHALQIHPKNQKRFILKKVYWLSVDILTVNANWNRDWILVDVRYQQVQWVSLNGITDNGINQLMESNLSWLTSPKFLFHTEFYVEAHLLIILYQSVFANSFSLSKSER